MPHPFQCIAYAKSGNDSASILLAACGHKLLSTTASPNALISSWSAANTIDASANDDDHAEQPKKKQKTEVPVQSLLNIIKLTISPDSRHVVAVTEDKHVRVFALDQKNTLLELSERILPKRPCALQVLPDNRTILVGDKFGDVYSLPLLPSAEEDAAAAAAKAEKQAAKTFKPSASNLTVHSKRNLESLESQMRQRQFTPRKEALAFVHQLLLGHVSMLTDALFIQTQTLQGNRSRGYIITADRDEHIRISRGPPQSHIIEGFCLGHTNFISKLCLAGTDTLVSGGGDDWIGVWDWKSFSLRGKVNIRSAIVRALATEGKTADDVQVAVSNLLSVPAVISGKPSEIVVAICEGVKALFVFDSSELLIKKEESVEVTTLPLEAQPVDLMRFDSDRAFFVVSLDQREEGSSGLKAYSIAAGAGTADGDFSIVSCNGVDAKLRTLCEATADVPVDDKKTNGLLYSIANLRKRGGWDQDNDG
ncbi:hypothetical protein K431DRAFT_271662 [Polychaeton citri CBS 116435]|uniref:Transfer RNA methyltransferase 82 n=1 Tax=Polychaeton citri CBS 116435 TaxID=1314669 RepID=A0A9P4UMS0_9PEZI|nr:hypothetical protein K431DRAFT_271662 [Polychaeton citri CBS 116435]